MASCLNKTLNPSQIEDIIDRAKDWALLHGIVMRTAQSPGSSEEMNHAPFSLFPSLVPEQILHLATSTQTDFNFLMHRVSHDHDFLLKCLKNVIEVDDFTRRLWNIYTTVRTEGITQPISLGMFRNDFMMDTKACRQPDEAGSEKTYNIDDIQLKQIEFNTISSAFGGLVGQMVDLHRYTMKLAGNECSQKQMPSNDPTIGLCKGLIRAWELYGNNRAAVMFFGDEKERNKMDQKWLEVRMHELCPEIPVIWKRFQNIINSGKLTEDKRLVVDGWEVAVVYFRVGYSPTQFSTEQHWEARLTIERSRAIKCPSIHYHLAGAKKVQQELSLPGQLERFFTDKKTISRIRETFVSQYSLDKGSDGDQAVKLGIQSPENFVLKPQREGGGHNYFGEELKMFLEKNQNSEERAGYILMERIYPWPQKNHLLKYGEDTGLRSVVSEIGVFGVYIGSETEEFENKLAGHLMRTKNLGEDEGGICAGVASLDTPFLITKIS